MQRKDIPNYLICPISQQLFLNPVTVFPSGITYEKEELDKLIAQATAEGKKASCPITRRVIENYTVAWALKNAVDDYLVDHPEAKSELYKNEAIATATNSQSSATASTSSAPSPDFFNQQQIQEDQAVARELDRNQNAPVMQTENGDRHSSETLINAARSGNTQAFSRMMMNNLRQRHLEEEATRLRAQEVGRLRAQQEVAQLRAQEDDAARLRTQQQTAARSARLAPSTNQQSVIHHENPNIELTVEDKKARDSLITDIQNLIFALKFERGPLPRGSIRNDSLVFFALIESAFLEPLPWQKIKVATGPNLPAMYDVLKAAIQALNELKPNILNESKHARSGRYDLVQTWLGGEASLNKNGYARFARSMGTIKNQPGYLVDQIIVRANHSLLELCRKYPQPELQVTASLRRR